MSKTLILRALVNERLTAAAEEIFGVVERFILEYEDEVFRSNQELDRQRRLLENLSFHNQMPDVSRTELPQLSDSEEDVPLEEQQEGREEEPEPPRIREERAELWTNQAEELWTTHQREELWANQKEEKLPLLCPAATVPVKTEQMTVFSEFSQSRVEMWENSNAENGEPCTSTGRMKTEPGGEGFGPSGSARDSERAGDTEPSGDFQEDAASDGFEDGDDCGESGGPPPDPHALRLNNIHMELSQELQSWSQAPSTPYCKVSRISFSSKYSIRNNAKGLSKDCSLSGRQLEPALSLRSHFKTHIMCNVCHKTFASKRILTMHMRTHTGERPFSCLVCGRTFSQSGNLLRHRRIHTGEKPFCCSVCGKTFSQRGNLLRHRTLHMGRNPIAAQFQRGSLN